jgi:putative Mg2+ transporter-C (MgtC) family protein
MLEELSPYITIHPTTITFTVNLFISIILGILIGAERESRGKDAGISTHSFVISGAMLFTFMSMSVDPASQSRIAAQVVTGIGFLGAGLILKDGTAVRSLTTAASIWFAGAIGMAIGFGYYQIAIIAATASIFIPKMPHVKRQNIKIATGVDDIDHLDKQEKTALQATSAASGD